MLTAMGDSNGIQHPKLGKPNIAATLGWAYLIVFFLTGFLLAVPPGALVFYIIMSLLALAMIVIGQGRLRIIGVALLLLALVLSVREYQAGKDLRARINQIRPTAVR
jgi:hypothetical protein